MKREAEEERERGRVLTQTNGGWDDERVLFFLSRILKLCLRKKESPGGRLHAPAFIPVTVLQTPQSAAEHCS